MLRRGGQRRNGAVNVTGRPGQASFSWRALGAALGLLFLALAIGARGSGKPAVSHAARSAVLFIGDGMGPAYVTATRVARGGSTGRLRMDEMPYTALVRTYASDSPVTDSAAAASAMACGYKTVNGALCQDATAVSGKRDGRGLESIAAWAKRRGMRVGVVTTARVTHATPAAFYAVENDRDRERAIARAAVASPLDFLLGGGRRYFRSGKSSGAGGARDDGENLEAAARAHGWTVVDAASGLRAVTSLEKKVLGLFADSHLPYEAEAGPRTAPTLVEMTRWALQVLKASGQPFLLVVEGGRIDHAGHENWARTLVDEMAAFDEAIGLALGSLDPKSTLLLATADHETGGLAINGYPEEKDGVWGTTPPWGGGEPYSVLTFATGPGSKRPAPGAPHGKDDARPAGITLADAAHTGVDVALYAWGAGAEQVRGTLENTAVYWLLRGHLEGKPADRRRLTDAPGAPPG
jgi:alkaline phosphatase